MTQASQTIDLTSPPTSPQKKRSRFSINDTHPHWSTEIQEPLSSPLPCTEQERRSSEKDQRDRDKEETGHISSVDSDDESTDDEFIIPPQPQPAQPQKVWLNELRCFFKKKEKEGQLYSPSPHPIVTKTTASCAIQTECVVLDASTQTEMEMEITPTTEHCLREYPIPVPSKATIKEARARAKAQRDVASRNHVSAKLAEKASRKAKANVFHAAKMEKEKIDKMKRFAAAQLRLHCTSSLKAKIAKKDAFVAYSEKTSNVAKEAHPKLMSRAKAPIKSNVLHASSTELRSNIEKKAVGVNGSRFDLHCTSSLKAKNAKKDAFAKEAHAKLMARASSMESAKIERAMMKKEAEARVKVKRDSLFAHTFLASLGSSSSSIDAASSSNSQKAIASGASGDRYANDSAIWERLEGGKQCGRKSQQMDQ